VFVVLFFPLHLLSLLRVGQSRYPDCIGRAGPPRRPATSVRPHFAPRCA
jgi:hypothetical protein